MPNFKIKYNLSKTSEKLKEAEQEETIVTCANQYNVVNALSEKLVQQNPSLASSTEKQYLHIYSITETTESNTPIKSTPEQAGKALLKLMDRAGVKDQNTWNNVKFIIGAAKTGTTTVDRNNAAKLIEAFTVAYTQQVEKQKLEAQELEAQKLTNELKDQTGTPKAVGKFEGYVPKQVGAQAHPIYALARAAYPNKADQDYQLKICDELVKAFATAGTLQDSYMAKQSLLSLGYDYQRSINVRSNLANAKEAKKPMMDYYDNAVNAGSMPRLHSCLGSMMPMEKQAASYVAPGQVPQASVLNPGATQIADSVMSRFEQKVKQDEEHPLVAQMRADNVPKVLADKLDIAIKSLNKDGSPMEQISLIIIAFMLNQRRSLRRIEQSLTKIEGDQELHSRAINQQTDVIESLISAMQDSDKEEELANEQKEESLSLVTEYISEDLETLKANCLGTCRLNGDVAFITDYNYESGQATAFVVGNYSKLSQLVNFQYRFGASSLLGISDFELKSADKKAA